MRYLLDTNVVVDYFTGRYPSVLRHFQQLRPDDVVISAIAVAELRFGADKSARPEENQRRIDFFLEDVAVADFDRQAAASYGKVRSLLESKGRPIGPNDMLIAAQAIARGLVLVTDKTAELEHVDGLALENWRTS